MAFADRLKEARLIQGLTQEQLAEKVGVAKTTYTGYEKGNREPNVHTIAKLMESLNVDANYLWQDEADFSIELFPTEKELIEKYRALDERGKSMVDSVLEEAYISRPINLEGQISLSPINGYYQIYRNGKWENYKKCEEMVATKFAPLPDIPGVVPMGPETDEMCYQIEQAKKKNLHYLNSYTDIEKRNAVIKAAHNDSTDPAEIEKMMQDLENLKRPE